MAPRQRATPRGAASRSLALLGTLALFAACADRRIAPLQLQVAQPAAGGRCGMPDITKVHLPSGLKTRISVRKRVPNVDPTQPAASQFVCDRLVTAVAESPTLSVPAVKDALALDIFVEVFGPPDMPGGQPKRLYVGSLLNVRPDARTLPPVVLYPTESFACMNRSLKRARAFHTATLLPNGEVLIYGGLVVDRATPAVTENLDRFFFVTAEAELYDPAAGDIVALKDGGLATAVPRAFHTAALLPGPPPYRILLVGGMTARADAAAELNGAVLALNNGSVPFFRLAPFDSASSHAPLAAAAADKAELLTYDPATRTLTRQLLDGFPTALFAAATPLLDANGNADGVASAGGVVLDKTMATAAVNLAAAQRGAETAPRMAASGMGKLMGGTLTQLGDDAALQWGGQFAVADPMNPPSIGSYVTGLGSGKAIMTSVFPAAMVKGTLTQFHTATAFPAPAKSTDHFVLVTGGFEPITQNGGSALQPPSADLAARVVDVAAAGTVTIAAITPGGGYVLDPKCMQATTATSTRYRAAGWESAVALPGGRVLVTGGAPTATETCFDCDGGTLDICATSQASLFTPPSALTPLRNLGRLQVARFGHSSTLLADGNVVVLGGVSAPGAAGALARTVSDVEVYNPRAYAPTVDAMTLADGDDPLARDIKDIGVRAPGEELHTLGNPAPTRRCPDL